MHRNKCRLVTVRRPPTWDDRGATNNDQAGSETNTELTTAQVAFLIALTTLGARLFTAAPGGQEFTGRPAGWQQLDPAGNGGRVASLGGGPGTHCAAR